MIKILKKYGSHILILSILILPVILNAQGGPIPPNPITVRITNPFNCGGAANCTLMGLIVAILNNIIMPIAAVAVTAWIIWAGFGFLTAQGNPNKIGIAQQRLLWSLIGAGILLGAVGIANVLENTVRALIVP